MILKVDNLVKEVSLSPLQVTLVGLLDVNLTLIPEVKSNSFIYKTVNKIRGNYNFALSIRQLIGITLTYIIILLQFKTSE